MLKFPSAIEFLSDCMLQIKHTEEIDLGLGQALRLVRGQN